MVNDYLEGRRLNLFIRLSIRRFPQKCLWSALLFGTVYQSYRYPLQYNFSGTSPTYTDTPVSFQLTKFLVIALLCLLSISYVPRRALPHRNWIFICLISAMTAYPLIKAIGATNSDLLLYLETAFWPLAALLLVLATPAITFAALDRYFRFVFVYALVSNAIEIALFLTIGRLPALAYAHTFFVRFGGFLDDPNGFAALLFMLMGWAYFHFSGAKRFVAQSSLILCIVLTQSLTAVGCLVLFGLWFLLFRRPRPLLILGLAATLASLVYALWSSLAEVFTIFSEAKNGSVSDHIAPVSSATSGGVLGWIFGGTSYTHYESWWVGSIVNYGVPWTLLCLAIVVSLTRSNLVALRRARSRDEKAVLAAVLSLSCYFLVGDLNLPFFLVFPVNLIFFLLAFSVAFRKIKEDEIPMKEPFRMIGGSVDGVSNLS